eukprot:TRINITY_DN5324_c0_g1_i3.p1 TRINITY_DN5324_c0_g1~~TRINITY_DN5324_c0_g1_i3.p1  ORF type:complete len:113 (-),score=45.60 TRINITY_DN5324_c0_g1_i3:82-420(-)
MGLFKKKKDHSKSLNKMKETLDSVEERQVQLERLINQRNIVIKQLLAFGKRKEAALELSKRKSFEEQLQRVLITKTNLEQQYLSLQNSSNASQVMDAMKMGTESQKKMNKEA